MRVNRYFKTNRKLTATDGKMVCSKQKTFFKKMKMKKFRNK